MEITKLLLSQDNEFENIFFQFSRANHPSSPSVHDDANNGQDVFSWFQGIRTIDLPTRAAVSRKQSGKSEQMNFIVSKQIQSRYTAYVGIDESRRSKLVNSIAIDEPIQDEFRLFL